MRRFLFIPNLQIHNANALSSPISIGFPAMTAWMGAMHALQRKIQTLGQCTLSLKSLAISCHSAELQTYKGDSDFEYSIIIKKTPLIFDKKYTSKYPKGMFRNMYDAPLTGDGFIEEARCHLDVSLLIECESLEGDQEALLLAAIQSLVHTMKWASGDVLAVGSCQILHYDPDADGATADLRKIRNRLMPGHVLIERRDLVQQAMQEQQLDALDAVLAYLKVQHRPERDDNGQITWTAQRQVPGWLVPIAVGFQGISDLGLAKNQRDPHTPHRFAEAILTLGQFVMPYRIDAIDDMLWHYQTTQEPDLYLCSNSSH
ncbi:type I-F CRISPR-associated protein Csy2 [Snodgrassella sp. CFCC 13594]|uniref:type I-F CRISPR-associated protein Csy2 n=1 Tax=Snodgrassella sp. CFCC 13594 TaxID=1775559 RepID=UPI000836C836|nr:type I-F CRISPR-associated protein Csy2 [Snodgrassella sp. CFCC 13594]